MVFDNKCGSCHGDTLSKSYLKDNEAYFEKVMRKAQKHFIISKGFPFESKHTMSEIFVEINKNISKGKMPPRKFLERYPEAALTVEEKKLILDWVK